MRKLVDKTRLFRLLLVLAAVCAAVFGVKAWKSHQAAQKFITYRVRRQNLLLSVREGGNLQALRSQKIVNEVPGQRNILEVVEEGTEITEEDVKNGRVLVRMDSKDLQDRLEQMQITVENSQASYTEAQENLLIQKKQNESDIKDAELKVKFALLDLEKYLGKELAGGYVAKPVNQWDQLLSSELLAGEALNRKREMETKIDLAREEVARAKDRVDWSVKLADKGFVTKVELEADKLALQQKEVALEQARLAQRLFLDYDFPKQVEKLYSDYGQALVQMERTRVNCQSRLIQAESNVRSRKATLLFNQKSLEDLKTQITQCTIRASQPGFVVYGTSDRPWRTESPIQPGTTVRQYQDLLSLPDFTSMGVLVKIHESVVDRVRPNQVARITVDAFPEKTLSGHVRNIALMPDPTLKWLNPDLNVYVAQIALDETCDFLKPGMSAQAEIIIKELANVLTVPLLAVSFRGQASVCRVLKGTRLEERVVRLGESNDEYAEVQAGLQEGDLVVLSAGQAARTPGQPASSMQAPEGPKTTPAAGQPPVPQRPAVTASPDQGRSLSEAGEPVGRRGQPPAGERRSEPRRRERPRPEESIQP